MLLGRFEDDGAPQIFSRVAVPVAKAMGDVSFLIDTGSDNTALMPIDAERMRIDYQTLNHSVIASSLGGPTEVFVVKADLTFAGIDVLYNYYTDILIVKPNDHTIKLPSVLGRDILSHWRMVYDPSLREIEIVVKRCGRVRSVPPAMLAIAPPPISIPEKK